MQAQVSLVKYPPETAGIWHQDRFLCFLKDEEFVSKTINDSSVDLENFSCKQSQAACKEGGEFKGHSVSHQTSCK